MRRVIVARDIGPQMRLKRRVMHVERGAVRVVDGDGCGAVFDVTYRDRRRTGRQHLADGGAHHPRDACRFLQTFVAVHVAVVVGQQVLDLSPRGVLVSSAAMLKLGDEIFISFLPPGDGRWMNAQAEVTRLIPGLRPWDPGPCAGLVFTNLSAPKRGELLARLAGIPPTVPRRPLRFGRRSRDAYANTVLPPVSRFRAPDGTWSDYYTRWNFLSLTSSAVAHGLFSNNYLKTVISTQQPVIQ